MKRHSVATVFAASCLTIAAAAPAGAGTPGFSDQTAAAGISGSFSTSGVLHSFLGGGTVGDFNADGFQDIFYPTGGNGPDKLFINDGDGTFTESAAAWGIATTHFSTAAAAGDYNGDGRLDIFVTSLGPTSGAAAGNHKLYRNNGSTFTDVATTAGVNRSATGGPDGWGAAWGDYDLDGDLDLAVSGWDEPSDGNRLYRNDGDGTFTDVTATAGVASIDNTNGFAPRFADMDGDRFPELIWIGDFTTGHYYANDGDGTFTDQTGSAGVNVDGTEMGMTVADWDEDGDFDFYVTTIDSNNLYINQGNNVYTNQAAAAGVVDTNWGWGTVAIDFDHDSLIDIVATAQGDRKFAFQNTSSGALTFAEIGNSIGLGGTIDGRGLANLDYDNDGDQDLVIFPHGGSIQLLRNDLTGSDIHWLRVVLERGTVSDIAPHGIGSVVEIEIGPRTLIGRVDGGSNYLSQSELSAHFGLGTTTIVDTVRVRWSNGSVTTLTDVAVDQTLTVTAGSADSIFTDGFESGSTSAWSSAVGE